MAPPCCARQPPGVPVATRYRFMTVDEAGVGSALRAGLVALTSATLDDGERYRPDAWRTLRPAFRVVALDADGRPVAQASCFWVPCRPATPLLGLGDVCVERAHRHRGLARTLCTLATAEGWRLHASAMLAKTRPLRTVLADLGYVPAVDGRFFSVRDGTRMVHPDWMAAIHTPLPEEVRLEEGDF
jgi:GNAT superfamily N-acetyltransferase